MKKTVYTNNVLEVVPTVPGINSMLAVVGGAGVLCFGPDSPLSDCLPVSVGHWMIVPAGLVVKAAPVGGSVTIVTGPYGV